MATPWSCGGGAQELDRYENSHVQFWEAMAMVSEHELAESQRQEDIDRARLRGEEPSGGARHQDTGWHASIDADMSSMFAGPSRRRSSCCRSCFWLPSGIFNGSLQGVSLCRPGKGCTTADECTSLEAQAAIRRLERFV